MEKNKSLDDAERKMKVRRGTRAGARGVALGPCPLSSEAGRETSVKAAGASCRCSFPCARTLTLLSPLACKQCDLRNLEAEMEQLKERLAQEELDRAFAEGQVQEMKQENRRLAKEKNEHGVAETRYRASAPSILCGFVREDSGQSSLGAVLVCDSVCAVCMCFLQGGCATRWRRRRRT